MPSQARSLTTLSLRACDHGRDPDRTECCAYEQPNHGPPPQPAAASIGRVGEGLRRAMRGEELERGALTGCLYRPIVGLIHVQRFAERIASQARYQQGRRRNSTTEERLPYSDYK